MIAGSRKIICNRQWKIGKLDDSLCLKDLGYKNETTKLKQLRFYYWNEESMDRGVSEYRRLVKKGKYGSIGITTHGNYKENFTQQGFCIQSIVFTYLIDRSVIDIFYRTTEIIKKFGADLVYLRRSVLSEFREHFEEAPLSHIRFHFTNLSVHPMFYVLLIPHDPDWRDSLERIKIKDQTLWRNIIRWTNRYLAPTGLEKYKQGLRTSKALVRMMDERDLSLAPLQAYIGEAYENLH